MARYADACNVFGSPDQVRHKYAVLRAHCETEGRDYDSIEKTNLTSVAISPDGARGSLTPSGLVDRLGGWAEAGSMHTIFSVKDVWDLAKLELIGRDVLPQVRALGTRQPARLRPAEVRSPSGLTQPSQVPSRCLRSRRPARARDRAAAGWSCAQSGASA